MRVNCLTFLDPQVHGGGGEMITRRLIESGRTRGHDIAVLSVRPSRRRGHAKPDAVLLLDVFNHGHSWRSLGAWRAFATSFIAKEIAKAPFVHLANAYTDVCNLPYLPCSGIEQPMRCPEKPLPLGRRLLLRDAGAQCFAAHEPVRALFERSAFNVYLSPLHRDVCERLLGLTGRRPSLILPPMIDTALFRNEGVPRDIANLFVGVIGEAKGLDEMRRRYSGSDITLIGRLAPGARLDFGRHVPHVPYQDVPRWMNRARNFVFLPRWPEPQGRVVAEAALCGCSIVGNDHVGALSFGFDLADPANYTGAEQLFWQGVEGLA